MVYLGKYSFDNPNPQAWYVEGANPFLTDRAPAEGVETYTDVHGQMVMWFTWMFANQLLVFGMPIIMGLVLCLAASCPSMIQICGTLLGCGFFCSGFVAWIMGMVYRFGAAGQFASGDNMAENMTLEEWELTQTLNQYQSGKFMGIYYLITWIMLGVSCGCALIGGLITCICK